MRLSRVMSLSAIALIVLSGSPPAQAQPIFSYTLAADNTGPLSLLQHPLINTGGSVAFVSSLDAGGSGIYTVAPSGSPIQAAGTGATFSSFGFANNNGFNTAGAVAFQAGLTAGGAGVFTVSAGGSPVTVAQTGVGVHRLWHTGSQLRRHGCVRRLRRRWPASYL